MTATEAPAPATFESLDPRTGDVVGTHPVHDGAHLELVLAIDHLHWAAKHAGTVLGRRKVAPGLLMGQPGCERDLPPVVRP